MPGEIRSAMAKLRAAKEGMVADMLKEIDSVQSEVEATRADGIEAMKLPRAELEATKQEIREIRAEFAPSSNGGPAGPLPGTHNGSSAPLTNGAQDQSAEKKT
jgi:hypothetical protein